ncbi:autotransporter domain-containing protein [Rhodoplanes sp. TEM]|uniref:Autotransporter domain-containing protein n=1 Tax=Rhodoplanes tepidamans TaxID=200616 RepID=A0ABT5JAF8_RHOTP|nr:MULTISPECIES: autotransporter outer membrane beta-barrel domain-containing protein [Rhodoplanes]MDC7786274.1 autotransporter domain-containing protein [Rhodoplanes tepidamans]MDC7982355.1 autotransporter domain-containing protein [Rhodoplanes sp. TEM]MDQ0355073.1 uncharacterized protein with beta-barrel porin domain [Rhodoplanes tepidamans]
MARLLAGVSRLSLMAAIAALATPAPALAADVVVPAGTTDTTAKTLADGTRLIVEETGALSVSGSTAVTWTVATPTGITIENAGTIESTNSSGRAIRFNAASGSLLIVSITNTTTGIIRSTSDAIQANRDVASGSVITIDNAGLITSTSSGQAIDLDAVSAATVTIVNQSTGTIYAADNDAIRPGNNFVITNYGQIIAEAVAVPTDRPSADGIDLQDDHTGTIYNYGLISGAKSGVNAGENSSPTVYNYAGGVIVGQDGSGIGSDYTATVYNWGTITGTIDTTSARGDGDGIDVDYTATIVNYGLIQGLGAKGYDEDGRLNRSEGITIGGGTIDNYGTISGADYGITVGNDHNTDGSRSGYTSTTIVNYAGATIVGLSGYAIRLENKTGTTADNDSIVNYGTIIGNGTIPDASGTVYLQDGSVDTSSVGTLDGVTYTGTGSARFILGDGSAIQMGEGADVLANYGTIIGNTGRAINMEGGADTVTIGAGSKIVGLVNGGAGTDTLDYLKVGLSDAKKAALLAGETVNIGGTLYTSFEAFTGISRSFSSYATSGLTSGIAWALDNGSTTTGASLATQTVVDRVASATDVAGAMAQLTPRAFQTFTTIGIDTALQTTETIGRRLTQARQGGAAFEMRGVDAIAALVDRHRTVAGIAGGPDDGLDPRLAAVSTAFASAAPATRSHPAFGALDPAAAAAAGMPLKAAPIVPDSPWGGFLQGSASTARQSAGATSPAMRYRTAGVTAGLDYRLAPDLLLGVFGGYGRTDTDLDDVGSTGTVTTWLGGLYGGWRAGSWFVQGAALYGRSDYDSVRAVLGTANTGSTTGDQVAVQGAVGTDLRFGRVMLTPELGLQYTKVTIDAFTETGDAALAVGDNTADSLRSNLGVRGRTEWRTGFGLVTPEWRAFWQHEYLDQERALTATFVDQAFPLPFATTVGGTGRDFGVLGIGLTAFAADRIQASIGYDFKFGADDYQAHVVGGRLRAAF